MKKSIFYFLVLFLFGVFFTPQASLSAQVMRKTLLVSQRAQATITAVSPRTVSLQQGGPAAMVTVDGKYLETILSVQAIMGNRSIGEITVRLVQPWPASRKIELQAGTNAPVAPGYHLAVFSGSGVVSEWKIDVPSSVFSLEVVGKKPQQMQQTLEKTSPLQRTQTLQGPETGNGTPKVRDFLKFVLTADSLAHARAEFTRLNFSQGEINQIKNEFESSGALRQKIKGFAAQYKADFLKRVEIRRKQADAKAATMKARWVSEQKAALTKASQLRVGNAIQKFIDCTADVPKITRIDSEAILPGQEFCILGEGLGTGPGAVDLIIGGKTFMVHVNQGGWSPCRVCGHLDPDEAVGVRANPRAMISLRTNTGRETRYEGVNFQPTLVLLTEEASGSVYHSEWDQTAIYILTGVAYCYGNNNDWTEFNFILKNDYYIYLCLFDASSDSDNPEDAHAEITASPPLNIPNCSAGTSVHAGTKGCHYIKWSLNLLIIGPKGLPYK